MSDLVLESAQLLWSGEHWIAYLRLPGQETDSGQLSLYHAHWSPSGTGTVAFVDIPGEGGFAAQCHDNPALATFLYEVFLKGSGTPFDRDDLAPVPARFTRGGDVRREPQWRVEAEGRRLVATWSRLEPPLVTPGFRPAAREGMDLFWVLLFAGAARLELDGVAVPGEPYTRDAWLKTTGRPRSSCCFALAETCIARR